MTDDELDDSFEASMLDVGPNGKGPQQLESERLAGELKSPRGDSGEKINGRSR